jgi:colanic acid/amylovoran biosynthesis glycosyltransferase
MTEQRAAFAPDMIAYVMTHYPRVALSFITDEIDMIERLGISIRPFAMNTPEPGELKTSDAQRRSAGTIYLKRSWSALWAGFGALLLRHPVAAARLLGTAIASARYDLALIARRLSHVLQASAVARECDDLGIRQIHAHFGQAPATIAWFAAEILNFRKRGPRANWSFTIHGFHDFVDAGVARLDLKSASAAFVVCISDYTRAQLCRVADPRDWPQFQVIRCGIDLTRFSFRGERPTNTPPRAINVGRLSPEKGQLPLVQAVALLKQQHIAMDLVIIGDGPSEVTIRQEIAHLGIEDRVTLAGELSPPEVRACLAEADLFCMASFAEGLPVSMMEAMAVGVPVVATNVGGIPELAIKGATALTVPAGNVAELALAMAHVAGDEGLRKRLSGNARARVIEMHSLEPNVRQLFDLFRDTMAANHGC